MQRRDELYEIVDLVMPEDLPPEFGIATPVPVVKVHWFDERFLCKRAQAYLEHKITGSQDALLDSYGFTECTSYRYGYCGGNGHQDRCLFREPDDSEAWEQAMDFYQGQRQLRSENVEDIDQ